jgi:peptidoglycan/xylan/chitin deacetylase (PgdA/CDA1 family)
VRFPAGSRMAEKIGTLFDRIDNRLVGYFPGPTVTVETTTPIVSFTFDDIPISAWTRGARILEEHGARGTFYVSGRFIDSKDGERVMVTADGCRDLVAKGHEIGCHTYAHRKISGFSRAQLADDIDRNTKVLTPFDQRTEKRNFSVPFGMMSLRQQAVLRQHFRSSRGILPGINRGRVDPYALAAVELRPDQTYLSKADAWLDDVLENPGWLIIFTHDVSTTPSFFGCPEEKLRSLVERAHSGGARIMTVDAAMKELDLVS